MGILEFRNRLHRNLEVSHDVIYAELDCLRITLHMPLVQYTISSSMSCLYQLDLVLNRRGIRSLQTSSDYDRYLFIFQECKAV
jgi:hypothetical protein